ncbi:MAG: hypothetical protein U1F98_03955 [Verrucomicrobiota bacterium]
MQSGTLNHLSPFLCSVVALLTLLGSVHPLPAAPAPAALESIQPRIQAALDRPDLAAYRGWIKFLNFEAQTAVQRSGADSAAAREKLARLADWLERISNNPALLSTLRGVQEWAYESPADGSGQPFRMVIPSDYDPARPTPMSLYMHGYSGNHIEHSAGMSPHPGPFEVAVLGRARGGWYVGLSQADVIDVLDYVQSHWNIDADRVHLTGGSMGGGATFRLGSRFPHRFASGQPTCGFCIDLPMGNLITFPLYATHSADDWTVPILTSRGPMNLLREMGGQVIFDETNGFGHAVWNYAAGNERGGAWALQQVRPDSRTVRRIDFTALDGAAPRAWWAEVAEWGPEPKPARFILTAGSSNNLYADLQNITRLKLRTAETPFDRSQPLRVSVNGAVPVNVAAPLPETIFLVKNADGWRAESTFAVPAARLHTPGGPMTVYNGSPLLIVYGTLGDAPVRDALKSAAIAASKSSHPDWLADGGEAGADGVPHLQNLYGRLNIKADSDVTPADIERCNLVLIGSADQNSVVEKMAARLPVSITDGKIKGAGFEVDAARRTLGLVYYNPLAPARLIFWVASPDAAAYAVSNPVVQTCGRAFVGADLLVMDIQPGKLVATGSFDSRWQWNSNRSRSALLPDSATGTHQLEIAAAEAVRRAAGADFALAAPASPALAGFTPGTTRVADLQALAYYEPVGVMDISGAELLAADAKLKAGGMRWARLQPEATNVDPARTYRVALSGQAVGAYDVITKSSPASFRMTPLLASEAWERFLLK